VSVIVLLMQMFQLCVESVWLVEKVDGDVQAGQYTHGVRNELGRCSVVTSYTVEQRTSLGNLSEHAATPAPTNASHP